jgi:phage-related protein
MANFNIDVNITPDRGLKADQQPRVLVAAYGDGYEQRVAAGINNLPESWSLTWKNRTSAEANKIVDFLETQGGVTAFDWYPTGYEVSSTTTYVAASELVDDTQFFTARYLNTTVTNHDVSPAVTSTVTGVLNPTTLTLAASIFSAIDQAYTIYPYKKYTCAKWSSQETLSGIRTVTATFTRVFEP